MDTDLERPRWRATAAHRVLPTLQLGFEWNPVAGELAPNATWFLLTETERRPALFLGTSSDRIGSPSGTQSYYATVARYLPALRTSPYVSLNFSEWDERWNVPFGASVELGGGAVVRPMYDGERTHLAASLTVGHASFTLLWVWLERAGVAVAFGF